MLMSHFGWEVASPELMSPCIKFSVRELMSMAPQDVGVKLGTIGSLSLQGYLKEMTIVNTLGER